ncbi:MAG: FAD-dependent oxidoreductase [Candidatus Coatesbacteria bacterium]|nr:FAD-dependent oxidoreductase [Candidatus Coatesbacteria bacterium]
MDKVLIIGTGIASLTAAMDLAEKGIYVYLLEKEAFAGGLLSKLNTVFPDDDPSICKIADLLFSARNHPNIELMTLAKLKSLKPEETKFKAKIHLESKRTNDDCNLCDRCAEVCPAKPFNTFNEGLSLRTAIDTSNPYSEEVYYIEKETPACIEACPVHIDIRKYIGLIASRDYLGALNVIREKNPLPGICGRVCNHPCETACNRKKYDEAISIDALKRFVSDYELALYREGKLSPLPIKAPSTKEKVAIIGAGPAGLTVAHDLAKMGYRPTIFERAPVPGGMLWLCIPEYRLPRDIIQVETEQIERLGTEIIYNHPIGSEHSLDDLRREGFKAIFIGVGAHKGLKLRIPGEDDFKGLLDCIIYLTRVNLGDKTKPGKKVIVIGGGNSAIDSARVSLRLGCDEVYILYRRSRLEMPANSWEVDAAEDEGVNLHFLIIPEKIIGENGRVTGIRCLKSKLGKLDASGRRQPVPIPGSEFEIECDLIIPAISQEPDVSWLAAGHGLEISKWNSFNINTRTGQTNIPHIFAGGDAVTGPQTVIKAIAAGHIAAEGIDKYLSN